MALLIDIADAVVCQLNDPQAGFDPPLAAQRQYRPQYDLAELKSLRVTVVPHGIEIASAGRNLVQHDVSIDLAVQKKVNAADAAELDGLIDLVQAIGAFFRLRRLTGCPQATWTRTVHAPVYSPEHLEQHRVFTSVLTITFRVIC